MSIHPRTMPTFLEEFRMMKLENIIRDLHRLSPEELQRIQQEIDRILKTQPD